MMAAMLLPGRSVASALRKPAQQRRLPQQAPSRANRRAVVLRSAGEGQVNLQGGGGGGIGGLTNGARAAAVAAATEASNKLDAALTEIAGSVGDLKALAKRNPRDAAVLVDAFMEEAIEKANTFKTFFAHGNPTLEQEVEMCVGHFVASANRLRGRMGADMTAGEVIDQMLDSFVAASAEMKDIVAKHAASTVDGLSVSDVKGALPAFVMPKVMATPEGGLGQAVKDYLQLWVSLGSLYMLDQAIKRVFLEYSIKFPSSLAGMFGIFALLLAVGDKNADRILGFYSRGLAWIARWLPLFYVPALVTLPLALNGIPGGDLVRIVGILAVGMVATLLFTAQTTVIIREAVKTPVQEIAKAKPSPPFQMSHYVAWAVIAATSLAATVAVGGDLGARMALPFGLACTVGGYLVGELVPKAWQGVLHPVVVMSAIANGGAALHGVIMGWDYATSQKVYLAKGTGPLGAGDLLMSLLGVVIISFGFRVYTQRKTMQRHAPEIIGATLLSAFFSLFSTAFAAKAVGLSAELARAIIPRSVTVALALPISQSLEAPLAITAAAVLLQGILGANFGPNLMSAVGIKDTIARGLAAAGTAGGLGTASLTSKEPEALPFCALSYAMVGIFSTLICSVPAVRAALAAIVA